MRREVHISLVAICSLLLAAVSTQAHHSAAAEFDVLREITFTGTITRVDWINPHTYIYVDMKNANGEVSSWGLETWPTGLLHKYGIKREMFVVGQTLAVSVNPAKDPTKTVGWLRHAKFENGDEINFKNNYVTDQDVEK